MELYKKFIKANRVISNIYILILVALLIMGILMLIYGGGIIINIFLLFEAFDLPKLDMNYIVNILNISLDVIFTLSLIGLISLLYIKLKLNKSKTNVKGMFMIFIGYIVSFTIVGILISPIIIKIGLRKFEKSINSLHDDELKKVE